MSYTVYLDESGTHADSPALAVAGYLADDSSWDSFAVDWRASLTEMGLDHFHMTDFSNKAGVYASWTEDERRERFARLVGITNRHAIASVGTVIERALYERLITGAGRERSGGLYGLAAISCAMTVDKRLPGVSVGYVFENGAQGRGQLAKVLRDNMHYTSEPESLRIRSVTFRDKRMFVPLQAADILAYELYQNFPRLLGTDSRPIRRSHLEQLAQIQRDWGSLDETQIKLFAEVITLGLEFGRGTWQRVTNPTIRPAKKRGGRRPNWRRPG